MAEKKGRSSKSSAQKKSGQKNKDQKKEEKKAKIKANPAGSRMKDEIVSVILVALGIFIIIAELTDATGEVGRILSAIFKGCFGLAAYILPFYLIVYALLVLTNRTAHVNSRTIVSTIVIFIDIDMMLSVRYTAVKEDYFGISYIIDMFNQGKSLDSAGAVGMSIGWGVVKLVDITGLVLIGIVVLIICIILIANTPISAFFDNQRIKRNQRKIDALAEKTESGPSDPMLDTMPLPVDKINAADKADKKEKKKKLQKIDDTGAGTAETSQSHDQPTRYSDGYASDDYEDNDVSGIGKAGNSADRESASFLPSLPSFLAGRKKSRDDDATAPVVESRHIGAQSNGKTVFRGSDNRRQIMDYMNDDSLFGPESSSADADDCDKVRGLGEAYEYVGEYDPADASSFSSASVEFRKPDFLNKNAGGDHSHSLQFDGTQNADYESSSAFSGGKEEDDAPPLNTERVFSGAESDGSVDGDNDTVKHAESEAVRMDDIVHNAAEDVDMKGLDGLDPSSSIKKAAAAAGTLKNAAGDVKNAKASAAELAKAAESVRQAAGAPGKSGAEGKHYELPPLDLLNKVERKSNSGVNEDLRRSAAALEKVLHDFGVDARVTNVNRGPAVTRYEVQPATGVKVSKIVSLSDDIALNLRAKSLRIEAPIPGKAAVGIEVQNDHSDIVSLREMIGSPEFQKEQSKIGFVVGEDVTGKPVVADLKGMPHMLIAGSTGSGKSVCINSIIISMLYKSTPDEVKFILIDPKVVELGNYNGIPHMLIPVVTDPAKAAAALAWAVQEMEARYKKFAKEKVKDLKSFNKKMKSETRDDEVMPQIVIIIDELADLMMAAAKQVEESICRLAQLARAAGMHMIVATQRPSVDVVTGLIKANVPSRIAFAVSSQVDSRTILDRAGAEKLVGKGDMLFSPLGASQPERLQGPFVTDEEVANVIEFWKEQEDEKDNSNDDMKQVMQEINTVSTSIVSSDDEEDELFGDAVELVVNAGQASASMLQRRFRIGYNRAGRLVDMMEAKGIIGPSEGSKPRKVLITKEEFEASAGAHASSGSGSAAEGK